MPGRTHLIVGMLGLVVFVLQGQYMDLVHNHLADIEGGPRIQTLVSAVLFASANRKFGNK